MTTDIVPEQKEGKHNDLYCRLTMPTDTEADILFSEGCRRLLAPNKWHEICGPLSASFTLMDEWGVQLDREPRENDYIRIDLPGPGPASGEGYDWVIVEALEHGANKAGSEAICAMRVRPVSPPQAEKADPAHFFKSTATSTFMVRRTGNLLEASYHGRNELPNTVTDKKLDNVRNAVVASGAMAGFSELQWQALIDAFLKTE